jgi:hypothetical protein
MRSPPRTKRSSAASERRVDSCVPVPNAMPGSISTTMSPGPVSASSQGGRTTMRSPHAGGLEVLTPLVSPLVAHDVDQLARPGDHPLGDARLVLRVEVRDEDRSSIEALVEGGGVSLFDPGRTEIEELRGGLVDLFVGDANVQGGVARLGGHRRDDYHNLRRVLASCERAGRGCPSVPSVPALQSPPFNPRS